MRNFRNMRTVQQEYLTRTKQSSNTRVPQGAFLNGGMAGKTSGSRLKGLKGRVQVVATYDNGGGLVKSGDVYYPQFDF